MVSMDLPANPPILPMLSKRIDALPAGPGWIFEPKWDGFRALIFRDHDEVLIQSRDAKSLNRYFPELIDAIRAELPRRCVLDGEIVIATKGALDFEALQLRIHPAESRVAMLARESPASIVFFDLICEGDRDLRAQPFEQRRAALETLLGSARSPIHVTPASRESAVAADWFRRFEGAGLDGVMAKPASLSYQADKRAMFKVKHERDCDCVVAGFRWYKGSQGTAVGSLLLGLFDNAGVLHHVGVCASFSTDKRRELVEFLEQYRRDSLVDHPWKDWSDAALIAAGASQRRPGGQSRWSRGKDLSWEPLRPELVVEVAYEHMQGTRFRHMAQFRRWRSDKKPADCTYAQLEVVPPQELAEIFGR